jgi:hypothetical protein
MGRAIFSLVLLLLSVAPLTACNEIPPTPEMIADQHRFEMGCRPEDAQGLERNMPYCGHNSRKH